MKKNSLIIDSFTEAAYKQTNRLTNGENIEEEEL